MSDQELPVFVAVRRPDGSVENVKVGTAVHGTEGFVLHLGELTVGTTPVRAHETAAPRASASPGGAQGVFPPYGRSKGMPIAGGSLQDLEFYATGARRTLADPSKARFHDKERALLATLEAEIARQKGGAAATDDPPPHGDDDYNG